MQSDPQGATPPFENNRLLAGRYLLLQKIGEGGAAEVYRAKDERLDRTVAVKLLRPQFVYDPASRNRFIIEAKAAAGLAHPNIVDIYDFGEGPDGTMFITMQYVDGQNLKDILQKRGRLSPAEAVSIAQQVCYALIVAHAAGLIHRDVKPQNIMIDRIEAVRLTDFGIVKALSGPALTQSGMTFGTAAYLSPEQATGEALSPASDIYSLGCVMYEMLAGTPPFTGDNPAVVAYKQVWEQPLPLHELVPEVPPSLEHVVMRCLNKDPAQRYPTADALATELESLKSGFNQPTQSVPVGGGADAGAASNRWVPAASRKPAELSQPILMPAAAGGGAVPPVRAQTTAYNGPPGARVPPAAGPIPRYASPPSAASGVPLVTMRGTRGAGIPWLPFLLAIALLVFGIVAVWKGGDLFGGIGGSAGALASPTSTASPTAQLGGVVIGSLVPPTNTPIATSLPSATPAELLPTPTPIAPLATVTPLPLTDTPAIPTHTPAPLPTDTPALPPQPTATAAPTQPAAPTRTPKPKKGKPTPKPKDSGQGYEVTLEDADFEGGYTRSDGVYHGVTATWVYGQGTQYSSMSAQFDTDSPPTGPATLTIRGLDSEDQAKTPIAISLNGSLIYQGLNPLPNDFATGVDGPGNWGVYTWAINPGIIQAGTNTLTITNLDPSSAINQPPFFMLDYAQISW